MNPDSAPASAGGRREQQRQEKRRAILGAAARLFAHREPDAVSMEEIAREADVATGTLYTYFPNKEELFAAAAQKMLLPIQPEVLALLSDGTRPPLERIREYLVLLHDHIEAHRTFFQTLSRLGIHSCVQRTTAEDDDAESCERIIASMMQALSQCIAEAQNRGELRSDISADHLAEAMRGVGRALTERRHDLAETEPIQDHSCRLFDLFLHGAQAR